MPYLTRYRTIREVFSFDNNLEVTLLKVLAEKGACNITNLANYAWKMGGIKIDRWRLKNIIHGSTRKYRGLIEHDYLLEVNEDRHRYKKQEKSYHLTLKGMIVSLQSVPPKNNYFFKKYLNHVFWFEVAQKVNRAKWEPFVREYVLTQIDLFLFYHFLNGIQLTWHKDLSSYFQEFFWNIHSMDMSIPTITNEHHIKQLEELVSNYTVLHTALGILTADFKDINKDSFTSVELNRNLPIQQELKNMNRNVFHWYSNQAILGEEGIIRWNRSKPTPKSFSANEIAVKVPIYRVSAKLKQLGYGDISKQLRMR